MDHSVVIVVAVIVFLAALVRSTIGFGDGLLAMPLIAFLIGVKAAAPLVAVCSLAIGSLLLVGSWRHIHGPTIFRLLILSAIGMPGGILLLRLGADTWLKFGLGWLLAGYGAFNLMRRKSDRGPVRSGLIYPFGILAGILGAAYNMQGIPLVVYGTLAGWGPVLFRSTLQVYLFGSGLLVVGCHGATEASMRSMSALRTSFIYVVPALVFGVWAGTMISSRISADKHHRLVNAAIMMLGACLLTGSIAEFLAHRAATW